MVMAIGSVVDNVVLYSIVIYVIEVTYVLCLDDSLILLWLIVPQLSHASNKAAEPSLVATSLVPHPTVRWRENDRLYRRYERGRLVYVRVGHRI